MCTLKYLDPELRHSNSVLYMYIRDQVQQKQEKEAYNGKSHSCPPIREHLQLEEEI